MVIGILDRGSISASISKFTPQIHSSTIQPPKKLFKTMTWLRPNLPSIPGYREPPRDNCLEAVHLVERLDCQKGWVDTPRHHGSDLPPIRETKHIWCIGVWLIVGSSVAIWWFFVCNNVLCVYCFALKKVKMVEKKKFTKWMISLW